jgi:hypothetical protein
VALLALLALSSLSLSFDSVLVDEEESILLGTRNGDGLRDDDDEDDDDEDDDDEDDDDEDDDDEDDDDEDDR